MVAFRCSLDPLSVPARCPDGINTNQCGCPALHGNAAKDAERDILQRAHADVRVGLHSHLCI